MEELGKQSLEAFLAAVAEATPAPGGGTSAAVGAAVAAALVEMCARLAGNEGLAAQVAGLREQALELAQDELSSYASVLEARSEEERASALAAASDPPARIAEVAAEVADLGGEIAASARPAVRGDAMTGVVLAEAAASAAACLVSINVDDGPAYERAAAAVKRAKAARSAAGF